MELVKYTLCDIELMMVDIEGTLYCSTPQLESVFGMHKAALTRMVQRYPKEFSRATCEMLTVSGDQRKEILAGLEIQRLRKNTRLWSEDDVIGLTWLARSDIARKCRVQFKEILKQHAKRDYVPRDQFEQLMAQHNNVVAQIPPLREAVEELMADKKAMASNAGRSLRLVRNK